MGFRSLRSTANGNTQEAAAARAIVPLGHIRMGKVVPAANGETRPTVADGWIITTKQREHADAISEFYGEPVQPFAGNGKSDDKWAVHTGRESIDIALAPDTDPDRMARYERFGGKGMIRSCEYRDGKRTSYTPVESLGGLTEIAGDCVCDGTTEPVGGKCKPKLRMDVFLTGPKIGVLGTFTLTSTSVFACEEIPAAIALIDLARVPKFMMPARIEIDRRTSQGGTKKYAVPVLRLSVSGQMLADAAARQLGVGTPVAIGGSQVAELGSGQVVEMVSDDVRERWIERLRGLGDAAKQFARDELAALDVKIGVGVPAVLHDAVARIVEEAEKMDGRTDEIEDAEVVQ